ncbi:MAG: TolC family protein [Planctomycetota bacterium]|nr:MAG: TolC family protein [Planctomycetota bacterium]
MRDRRRNGFRTRFRQNWPPRQRGRCLVMTSLRQLGFVSGCGLVAFVTGCATSSTAEIRQVRRPPVVAVESSKTAHEIQQATFTMEVLVPSKPEPQETSPAPTGYSIDLASALQLAAGQNPSVAFARERINEAYAQHARAEALWLPSIRAGANWNKHEGRIQDVAGNVFNTSRGSYFGGLGANAVGAGSPMIPGIIASFHLTDAIHQPTITGHAAASRQYSATVAEQDVLLQTAIAYLELLRANQELAIARNIEQLAHKLTDLTKAYADTGQGLAADHDRARAELAVRRNESVRAEEGVQVAGARLAQLLHIDPSVELLPTETTVAPLSLTDAGGSLPELVATGLSHRAEICEQRQLVAEACARLKREKHAPLLPSVLLGVSYGGFGGGLGDNFRRPGDRLDADAIAFWEVRNLGLGEKAARDEANSRVNQARWREIATLDRIAREVVEAHAQVTARQRQLAVAEEGVQAATSSFERNSERIRNAQGLPLETLQSLQALAQARREYLRTINDYNVAQFQLQHALGWSNGGQPFQADPIKN